MTGSRRRLANLALLVASMALSLLILEIACRVLLAGRGGGEDGAEQQYLEFDDRLGWHKRPGAGALFRRKEFVQEIRINSLGQRDPERVYDRRPGTFRILALGDSYLEGYTVPLEATVTQVLEARLNRAGCPVEVLNAGTTGYSTDQELAFYRNEGFRYEANLVAVFFYYNDIEPILRDDYYGRAKPQFLIQDGPLQLKQDILQEPPRLKPKPPVVRNSGWPHSVLFGWIQERLLRGQPGLYNRLATLGLWEPLSADPPRHDLGVYRRVPPSWVDPAWVHLGRILSGFKADVAAHGAQLVLVYIPNPMEISERSRELTRLAFGMSDSEWDVERVQRRLTKLAAREEIPLVDLTAALRGAEGVVSGPYLDIDRHWSALGHRTAASEIARRLGEARLLPDCAGER